MAENMEFTEWQQMWADLLPSKGKLELIAFVTRLDTIAQEALGKNMKLTTERDECKIVLKAWQDTFETTQLTHASCRLDSAERKVEMLAVESGAAQKIIDAAHELSIALHKAEAEGIVLPNCVDDAWMKFTMADQAALREDRP